MNQAERLTDRAVVVWANHFQFAPAEVLRFPAVRSRNLIWCLHGHGQIIANGRRVEMTTGRFLVMPWEHSLVYRAAVQEPFIVGGVHTVPVHDRRHPVTFHVAHGPDRDLWHAAYRRDVQLPSLSDVIVGDLEAHPALGHLAEYVVACFTRDHLHGLVRTSASPPPPTAPNPGEIEMRRLGQLVLLELVKAARQAEARPEIPPQLQRLSEWAQAHLDQAIGLEELSQVSGSSRSTMQRLIRRYFGVSALEWIIRLKLSHARSLLLSTSLPVSQVARRVGFADPYYFSRLFRAKTGESPRQYRSHGRFM